MLYVFIELAFRECFYQRKKITCKKYPSTYALLHMIYFYPLRSKNDLEKQVPSTQTEQIPTKSYSLPLSFLPHPTPHPPRVYQDDQKLTPSIITPHEVAIWQAKTRPRQNRNAIQPPSGRDVTRRRRDPAVRSYSPDSRLVGAKRAKTLEDSRIRIHSEFETSWCLALKTFLIWYFLAFSTEDIFNLLSFGNQLWR